MTEETLLVGGRVRSPAAPDATALAVRGGTVLWVGRDEPGRAAYPHARVVDLAGAHVTPAFVDAHVHATSAGRQLTGLDLRPCASAADCLDLLRDWLLRHPGEPVWGHGWDDSRWSRPQPPTRAELDAVAGAAPVYLSRVDVHSALVSTALVQHAPAARTAAGWSAQAPLTRAAHHEVRRAAQAMTTVEQRRAAQVAFLRDAAAAGIAAVHECAGPEISGQDDLAELIALSGKEDLPRVVAYWGEIGAAVGDVRGLAGDLFVDGALGSRTAALREPYRDAARTRGSLYLDRAAIAGHVAACTQAGVQAGFHVIGDAAVTEVVAGFALAERAVGRDALVAAGHRLEHLEMVDAEQAARLAGWGVIASVQPMFDAEWGGRDGMYAQRLGPDAGSGLNPFATLAAAGVLLAFGSDTPVTAHHPWPAVRAAVLHRTPGQGLTPDAAFTAHTVGGWRATGTRDPLAGTLVPGAPATYAVWDTDGLACLRPGATLPVCLRTVLDGTTIYERMS